MPGYYEIGRTITAAQVLDLEAHPVVLVPRRPYVAVVPQAVLWRLHGGTFTTAGIGLVIGYPGRDVLTIGKLAVEDSIGWSQAVNSPAAGVPEAEVTGDLLAFTLSPFTAAWPEAQLDLILSYLEIPTGFRTY